MNRALIGDGLDGVRITCLDELEVLAGDLSEEGVGQSASALPSATQGLDGTLAIAPLEFDQRPCVVDITRQCAREAREASRIERLPIDGAGREKRNGAPFPRCAK